MSALATPVAAVVVDFDGTIVEQDVSEEILAAFAPPEWWDIDLEFQRGEIGSRECLVRQAALVRGDHADMLRFAADRHALDPTFRPFVEWARASGITVAVASDGFGFYIEPMLRAAGIQGVAVHTNRVRVERGGPPAVSFPEEHAVCRTCGVCKMSVVERYRSVLGPVAFVGEGHTDRYGALFADVVYAKRFLPAICRSDGVAFVEWETFDDVRASLEAGALRDTVANPPARCPGWPEPTTERA